MDTVKDIISSAYEGPSRVLSKSTYVLAAIYGVIDTLDRYRFSLLDKPVEFTLDTSSSVLRGLLVVKAGFEFLYPQITPIMSVLYSVNILLYFRLWYDNIYNDENKDNRK